jgi:putative FmdB family regulatory protein
MPIYEFYCPDCNTIFSFFSRRVNTEKIPSCPGCGQSSLSRMVSSFSTLRNRDEVEDDDLPLRGIDESKLMDALSTIEEADGIDEGDPRQAARLMRRLTDMTGLSLGPRWEEAMERLEGGESPDEIEEELGEMLDDEEPLIEKKGKIRRRPSPPIRDETLYEL